MKQKILANLSADEEVYPTSMATSDISATMAETTTDIDLVHDEAATIMLDGDKMIGIVLHASEPGTSKMMADLVMAGDSEAVATMIMSPQSSSRAEA